mmetsp:Transcript_33619/g.32656  ORF Transcript_33619/g.32656 Transcript_33619/m.32656 type:complete len:92 (+) Transcript_33619:50-325(+)
MQLKHPNIIHLKNAFVFHDTDNNKDEKYLNLVMEYVPDTVYKILKSHNKQKIPLPSIIIKLLSYQLLRALAYIHATGICHRDIKPQNLLVD